MEELNLTSNSDSISLDDVKKENIRYPLTAQEVYQLKIRISKAITKALK